jgi:5-methylcytosine-specific restriction endonuclease McrA
MQAKLCLKNPKLSKKDIQLLKSALRRSFPRSDIYKKVSDANRIEHSDPRHPRGEKWSWCSHCGEVVPTWTTDVDHVDPVIPLNKLTEDMDPHELLDRSWLCDPSNLQVLCTSCHKTKTSSEKKLRPKSSHLLKLKKIA